MKFKLTDAGDDTRTTMYRDGIRVEFTGDTYETTDKAEINMLKAMNGVEQVKAPKKDDSND
jgi:hypothetical protein